MLALYMPPETKISCNPSQSAETSNGRNCPSDYSDMERGIMVAEVRRRKGNRRKIKIKFEGSGIVCVTKGSRLKNWHR